MLMATTMKVIGSITLSSSASSVTFSDIPATFNDLMLHFSARDTVSAAINAGSRLIFNGSSTGYSWRTLRGAYSFTGSTSSTTDGWIRVGQQPGATATSNTFGIDSIYIPNYASSVNKSVSADGVAENNAGNVGDAWNLIATAGLWASTAAITSIQIQSNSTAWAANSSFYLYGIRKA